MPYNMPMNPYMHAQMHPETYFLSELSYALIIVFMCLFIYARTRELYELSDHEGIRFFRQVFFFFALAYLLRMVPMFLRAANVYWNIPRFGFFLGLFLFGYASTMAVLTLGRSIAWKRLKKTSLRRGWPYHLLAIILPFSIFIGDSPLWFFLAQAILIFAVFVVAYQHHHRRKNKRRVTTFYTYILLLLFWLLNIAIMTIPRFMREAMFTLYALSIALFLIIALRVNARVKGR